MTHEEQVLLTQTVLKILHAWQVSPDDQVRILGENIRPRKLAAMRNGTGTLNSNTLEEKAQSILSIQQAVLTLNPHNEYMANLWITTRNRFFGNQTPLHIILTEGDAGMQRILNNLNGYEEW